MIFTYTKINSYLKVCRQDYCRKPENISHVLRQKVKKAQKTSLLMARFLICYFPAVAAGIVKAFDDDMKTLLEK